MMITFKQYLIESRSAPLYHGTSYRNLAAILRSNVLRKGDFIAVEHPTKDGRIVSLTRNKAFAIDWAREAAIELDQRKLTHRYKIQPFNFYSEFGKSRRPQYTRVIHYNQYEEAVHEDIKDIRKYIVKIIVHKDEHRSDYQDILELADKHKISVEIIK